MKLRLRSGSLRLRLTRTEVAGLANTGQMEESIQFGLSQNECLHYRVLISPALAHMTAGFRNGVITVQLPLAVGQNWASGDGIGLYETLPSGLRLIVEKDFKCLEARPQEDDSDAFEHPSGTSGARCGVAAVGTQKHDDKSCSTHEP